MRSRAQQITAVLVLLRLAAAQVSGTLWSKDECLRLHHLLGQNIPLFRKLRDAAKWSAIIIFTLGLFILCTTHIVKTGSVTHRLTKLIILALLTVVSLFSFAAVIYIRENSLSNVNYSLQVYWDNHKQAFKNCTVELNKGGHGWRDFSFPKINNIHITTEEKYNEVIKNAPTIGAFWVIGPAFIAIIAVWFMLFILREWHLERSAEPPPPNIRGIDHMQFDGELGSSRPDSGKHWRPASDTGVDDPTPDPDSIGSILDGHCAICNHSLEMFSSTELNCYHRVHDACIFKERKTVNSKKGLKCPACAKRKSSTK